MEISFKPALLSAYKTWDLSGNYLTSPNQKEIALSAVTKAHYIDMPIKGRWITELKLTSPDKSVTILCNDTRQGKHRHQCFLLIHEVLTSLQTQNPTLKIRCGYGRIANYAFASIALIPFGFGLSFVFEAIKRGPEGLTVGIAIGFMLAAVFLLWCASPWQTPPMITPQALQTNIFGQPT